MKQKRFKNKNSLPLGSLLQLSILIFGLVLAVFLTDQAQKYIGRAGVSPTPNEVKISNFSNTSFSVSWVTDKPATGALLLKSVAGLRASGQVFFDDRQGSYTSNSLFTTHHVTLKNLTPGLTYSFAIQSGKEKYQPPTLGQIILPSLPPSTPLTPVSIYGTILNKKGNPAAGVIIYLETKKSSPVSVLTDQNGNFALTLTTTLTRNLTSYFKAQSGELSTLTLNGGEAGGLKKDFILTGTDQQLEKIKLK